MQKLKIVAMYLPQFHQIPENDEFWGKGFTDWETVKRAKPLYEGHCQPRVPLNGNYYDLSQEDNVEWQTKLAYEHGIYGFGVYHYWFNNEKNLLTRPAEIIRDSQTCKIKYFFVWDNNSWVRSWSNVAGNAWAPNAEKDRDKKKGPTVLIQYVLGEEPEWLRHYEYLREHFKSNNYEKINNKPVFCILSYNPKMKRMFDYWEELAKKDGYDGIHFILMRFKRNENWNWISKYTYQPHFASLWKQGNLLERAIKKLMGKAGYKPKAKLRYFDYDKTWEILLKQTAKDSDGSIINGGFVDYDDSPRRGAIRGNVFKGATPEKFKTYFTKLVDITILQKKEYLFLTAWNEWGEGAYLEPDEHNGFAYLEAVKDVLMRDVREDKA